MAECVPRIPSRDGSVFLWESIAAVSATIVISPMVEPFQKTTNRVLHYVLLLKCFSEDFEC